MGGREVGKSADGQQYLGNTHLGNTPLLLPLYQNKHILPCGLYACISYLTQPPMHPYVLTW